MDGKGDFFEAHDAMDNIERELFQKHKISCTIHLDPIITDDEQINALKEQVREVARTIGEGMHIHDFRCVEGPTHTNIIFDVEVPYEEKKKDEDIVLEFEMRIKDIDEKYFAVINVDRV